MRFSLAVVACLAVGFLLTLSGTGLAITGLSSVGPAVQAQYPDATELAASPEQATQGTEHARLADLRQAVRTQPAAAPTEQAQVTERFAAALAQTGPGLREFGSIPLLLAGIAVFSLGGLLRFRRNQLLR